MHHATYKAMGMLQGTIVQKAESIFSCLSTEDQQKAQQIFLRLVRTGVDEADTRRRATSSELGEKARSLLKTLADERLVVISRFNGSMEDTIEVSHESLIRHWDRLKGWVKADRAFMIWRQRVELLAGEWDRVRDPEVLLRGKTLEEAKRRIAGRQDTISARMMQFMQASIAQEERVSFLGALRVFGFGAVQRELEQRMQTLAQGRQRIVELQKHEEELRRQMALWDEQVRCAETALNKSIPNVFISYAKEDRESAGRLFKALKDNGLQPWMDEEHILPGQDWQLSIQKAMEKADFLLICLSRHSIGKTGFVQREMKRAVELQQDLPEGQVRLIPVCLEDCDIPNSMNKLQGGNLYEQNGLDKVIRSMFVQWSKRNRSQSD
jgi:hypothetical protein